MKAKITTVLTTFFFVRNVTAQGLGTRCQKNADCSGYSNPCCGYPTASVALGVADFGCG